MQNSLPQATMAPTPTLSAMHNPFICDITEGVDNTHLLADLANMIDSKHRYSIPLIDQPIFAVVKPDLTTGPWIAGGSAMRWYQGEIIDESVRGCCHDIDVFFNSPEQFDVLRSVVESLRGCSLVYNSNNAMTYKVVSQQGPTWTLQLIKTRWFESAQDVIDNFDIRAVQICTDGREFIFNSNTLSDIKNRRLYFNKFTPGAGKRLIKYIAYGFTPDPSQLLHILSTPECIPTSTNVTEDYETAF